jgi:hypothetical protein
MHKSAQITEAAADRMRCRFRHSQSDIDGNHKAIPSIAAHKMA